ncbi:MAG TPA: acyltransferase [Thermoleophilaceae bacterium]
MPAPERNQRAAGLDGLRGLAALTVLTFHVWLYHFPDPANVRRDSFGDYVASDLRLGLILFFVLSGYLLYRGFARAALRREGMVDLRSYVARRAARILPAYYIALVGTFALLWDAKGVTGLRLPDESDLPLFAIFAQNYNPHTMMSFNPVTWTLCVEILFYALLPLLGLLAYRFFAGSARRQLGMLLALVATGVFWNWLVYSQGWNMVASKALIAYLPYFAAGMLVALLAEWRLARTGEPLRFGPLATAAIALAGFGAVVANSLWHISDAGIRLQAINLTMRDLPAGTGFGLLVLAVVAGTGPAIAWSRFRPLVAVGVVSYALYLWHLPLMLFEERIGAVPGPLPLRWIALLVPSLAVAAASWLLVEKRVLAKVHRVDRRRRERRTKPTSTGRPALESHAAP